MEVNADLLNKIMSDIQTRGGQVELQIHELEEMLTNLKNERQRLVGMAHIIKQLLDAPTNDSSVTLLEGQ